MAARSPLTRAEIALIDKTHTETGIDRNDLLPNDGFIMKTPYASGWYNDFFKKFIQLDGDMNENLQMLNNFETLLAGLPAGPDKEKKGISVQNRKKELLEKAYVSINGAPKEYDKVACCIVRSDGFALYVRNTEDSLGFPKGDLEYILTNPVNINSVQSENPVTGALRELVEETGFVIQKPYDFSVSPHTIRLTAGADTLNIINSKVERENINIYGKIYKTFYLILYTNTVAPLADSNVPQMAKSEGLVEKLWNKQFDGKAATGKFNEYSKKPRMYKTRIDGAPNFRVNTYAGGKRRVSKKKRTIKRKYARRKTHRRTH